MSFTNRNASYFDISYSDDGQWVIFVLQRDNWDNTIYRIRSDGTDLQALTEPDPFVSQPQWFPVVDLPLRNGLMIVGALIMASIGLWGMYA